MIQVKPGDMLELVQANGNRLIIIVYSDSICIKANDLGTKLDLLQDGTFFARASAVDN